MLCFLSFSSDLSAQRPRSDGSPHLLADVVATCTIPAEADPLPKLIACSPGTGRVWTEITSLSYKLAFEEADLLPWRDLLGTANRGIGPESN